MSYLFQVVLAVLVAAVAAEPGYGYGGYYGRWYNHENLRDERVEAFTTRLWPGVYTYTYVVEATTPPRCCV